MSPGRQIIRIEQLNKDLKLSGQLQSGQPYNISFLLSILMNPLQKPRICLITTNAGKVAEFKEILGERFELEFQSVELPELQGDPETIAIEKAKYAFNKLKKPILVDDGSLCFNAYKGLPGPYIKWFLKNLGTTGLAKMVEPFEDKTASAVCILAYMSTDLDSPKLFIGKVDGKIVSPRGSDDFGWFSIFEPKGHEQTLSQMEEKQRNRESHRFFACQQLTQYFLNDK